MRERERVRFETLLRIKEFGRESATDFPETSLGGRKFAELGEIIDEIEAAGARQAISTSGTREGSASKETARENLGELLSEIARTARSMVYEVEGVDEKFRMPRNRSDLSVLAAARGFLEQATPLKTKFVEYEMPDDFLNDLQDKINAFESAMSESNTAIASRVSSIANFGEIIRRGMIIRTILDGIVRNKYRANVGKLAAWTSASHIERPPRRKPDSPPST